MRDTLNRLYTGFINISNVSKGVKEVDSAPAMNYSITTVTLILD